MPTDWAVPSLAVSADSLQLITLMTGSPYDPERQNKERQKEKIASGKQEIGKQQNSRKKSAKKSKKNQLFAVTQGGGGFLSSAQSLSMVLDFLVIYPLTFRFKCPLPSSPLPPLCSFLDKTTCVLVCARRRRS